MITDVTANNGLWNFLCVSWQSDQGQWRVMKNGKVVDQGRGLAKGKIIQGNWQPEMLAICSLNILTVHRWGQSDFGSGTGRRWRKVLLPGVLSWTTDPSRFLECYPGRGYQSCCHGLVCSVPGPDRPGLALQPVGLLMGRCFWRRPRNDIGIASLKKLKQSSRNDVGRGFAANSFLNEIAKW